MFCGFNRKKASCRGYLFAEPTAAAPPPSQVRSEAPPFAAMRIPRVQATALASFAWIVQLAAQGTLQITFDGNPPQPPGTSIYVQQYFESGLWFRPLGVVGPGNGFSHRRGGGQLPFYPDNGTAYLAAALGDSLAFSLQNGSLFGITAVELAGYSTNVPDFTVNFIGYRPDGTTITTNFSGTGVNFLTAHFNPDWGSGLARVEIPNYGWSLDDLNLSVPEPTPCALLFCAAAAFWLWRVRCQDPGLRDFGKASGSPPHY
jgi:hypothetical protein